MRQEDQVAAIQVGPILDRPLDRWRCPHAGTDRECPHGPHQRGRCMVQADCRPRRTWRGWVNTTEGVIAIAAALLLTITVVCLRPTDPILRLVKPGPLSSPHAQILSQARGRQRCEACHEPSSTQMLMRFVSAEHDVAPEDHRGLSQRCMECHQATMSTDFAMAAHSLDPARLSQRTADVVRLARLTDGRYIDSIGHAVLSTSIDQSKIECSVCHREHHGAMADLTVISNTRCQSCHANRMDSLAEGHPEFGRWPYLDADPNAAAQAAAHGIAYDHASHAHQHFPSGTQPRKFDCIECHDGPADQPMVSSVDYQTACASCHDESLRLAIKPGITLAAFPMLPREVVRDLPRYPSAAIGFADGKLSHLHRWLIQRDLTASQRDRLTVAGGQVARISDKKTLAAVARSTSTLLSAIAKRGSIEITDRLDELGIERATADRIANHFPSQLIPRQTQIDTWVRGDGAKERSPFRVANFREDDLLLFDDENDPSADALLIPYDDADDGRHAESDAKPDSGQAVAVIAHRGWFRDDVALAIAYRPTQHADSVLRGLIEAAYQGSRDEPLPAAALACVQCHPGGGQGLWQSPPRSLGGFTKFDHRPHRNIDTLADCLGCHQPTAIDEAFAGSSRTDAPEFASMQKSDCAACHQPHLAGDSCTDCHRYHIDAPSFDTASFDAER